MKAVYKGGAFIEDPWAQREVLTVAAWQERQGGSLPSPLGLQIDPGFAIEMIADDLASFALIKVAFPKFTDGRGYSMGWILRRRYGFVGEMRATGDVLFDEMQLMTRCGFDAFEVVDEATLNLLKDGRRIDAFDRFYQPGLSGEMPVGTRPWARRARPAAAGTLDDTAC